MIGADHHFELAQREEEIIGKKLIIDEFEIMGKISSIISKNFVLNFQSYK
jgi:hypothetical protein